MGVSGLVKLVVVAAGATAMIAAGGLGGKLMSMPAQAFNQDSQVVSLLPFRDRESGATYAVINYDVTGDGRPDLMRIQPTERLGYLFTVGLAFDEREITDNSSGSSVLVENISFARDYLEEH